MSSDPTLRPDPLPEDADDTRAQLEQRLNEVVGIDPYEAAARLSGLQGALESALTVHSLTRSLSLVRFLQ